MTDFIPVLAAGVLLFIILIVAFGSFFGVTGDVEGTLVDQKEGMEFRKIVLGEDFSIGKTKGTDTVATISGTVSKGLISGRDRTKSFKVKNPDDVAEGTLNLEIEDTNLYGRLRIYLNNKLIYSNFSHPGNYTIKFAGDIIQDENLIEIKADSSGWRIWAPTTYKFTSDFELLKYGAMSKTFEFEVTEDELDELDQAILKVYVRSREGTGQMDVKLNNENIYSGVRSAVNETFSPVTVDKDNEVIISSTPGTSFNIVSAEILLYWDY